MLQPSFQTTHIHTYRSEHEMALALRYSCNENGVSYSLKEEPQSGTTGKQKNERQTIITQ